MYDRFSSPEYSRVQPHILDALDRYGQEHKEPGDFLMACLRNNFAEACCRADDYNRHVLPEIARYIYNHLPGACWGNDERVKAWLAKPVGPWVG